MNALFRMLHTAPLVRAAGPAGSRCGCDPAPSPGLCRREALQVWLVRPATPSEEDLSPCSSVQSQRGRSFPSRLFFFFYNLSQLRYQSCPCVIGLGTGGFVARSAGEAPYSQPLSPHPAPPQQLGLFARRQIIGELIDGTLKFASVVESVVALSLSAAVSALSMTIWAS